MSSNKNMNLGALLRSALDYNPTTGESTFRTVGGVGGTGSVDTTDLSKEAKQDDLITELIDQGSSLDAIGTQQAALVTAHNTLLAKQEEIRALLVEQQPQLDSTVLFDRKQGVEGTCTDAYSVSFTNVGTVDTLIQGIPLLPNESVSFTGTSPNGTLEEMTWDASAGSLIIAQVGGTITEVVA